MWISVVTILVWWVAIAAQYMGASYRMSRLVNQAVFGRWLDRLQALQREITELAEAMATHPYDPQREQYYRGLKVRFMAESLAYDRAWDDFHSIRMPDQDLKAGLVQVVRWLTNGRVYLSARTWVDDQRESFRRQRAAAYTQHLGFDPHAPDDPPGAKGPTADP